MQVFVRGDRAMIAAPVQCDVDGVPNRSHSASVLLISNDEHLTHGSGCTYERWVRRADSLKSCRASTPAIGGGSTPTAQRLAVQRRSASSGPIRYCASFGTTPVKPPLVQFCCACV